MYIYREIRKLLTAMYIECGLSYVQLDGQAEFYRFREVVIGHGQGFAKGCNDPSCLFFKSIARCIVSVFYFLDTDIAGNIYVQGDEQIATYSFFPCFFRVLIVVGDEFYKSLFFFFVIFHVVLGFRLQSA